VGFFFAPWTQQRDQSLEQSERIEALASGNKTQGRYTFTLQGYHPLDPTKGSKPRAKRED
jgi:hypothetical protein